MSNILLVEDDCEVSTSLTESLHELGHEVRVSSTGADAVGMVLSGKFDLVLLDLGLPDMDGSTVLTILRTVSTLPVIVVTARTERAEVVRLLDLGADDHVTKPFDVGQLEARIRAVLRRVERTAGSAVQLGELRIDPQRREVRLGEQVISLRVLEFEILLALAQRPGTVVDREDLIKQVWGSDARDGDRRLDNQLSILRAKLGDNGRDQRLIRTMRGVGVMLDVPASGRP